MKVKTKPSLINRVKLRNITQKVKKINALKEEYQSLSNQEMREKTGEFKERLANGATLNQLLVESFALVREACHRVLGLFPYDEQVMGGIALHDGSIAEMKTGEGKTLTATMPLYLNALEGKGAMLVTTNSYLAKRDAEEMGPVFEFLDLTVGVGVFEEDEEVEVEDKQAVYASDIIYTTAAALGFDYLTENLSSSKKERFLRPFNYVIVDEADAVLLDIAQTPLIISGVPRVQSNLYDVANQFVKTLIEEEEFYLDEDEGEVFLTNAGIDYAESYFDIDDLYDLKNSDLNRQINLALQAEHLYRRDYNYVVQDGEVKLLDRSTGRVMEGTRLQAGVHQAIETKERVNKTKESRAIGSVTYQSLFNMFPKLAGMTGTGKWSENELIEIYRLPVVVIPTHKPIIRVDYPDRIFTTLPEKLYATIEAVKDCYKREQPVLLVSGSVEIANIYSQILLQEGIPHNTLTANNVAKEALIIEEAGQKGRVTCATVMAGRGTDIKLGEGVAELGGLAVIGTERMENRRMDWQLRGRSGRQGDPGWSQFFVSLEDDLFVHYGPKWVQNKIKRHLEEEEATGQGELTSRRYQRAINLCQLKSEDQGVSRRQSTVQFDESLRVQRNMIYSLRDDLINAESTISNKLMKVRKDSIQHYLENNEQRTRHSLRRYILDNYSYDFHHFPEGFNVHDDRMVIDLLESLYDQEVEKKATVFQHETEAIEEFYRLSVLKAIDDCWVEEVDTLQQLKAVISTRQIAQRNGMFEYYIESLSSYEELSKQVKDLIIRNVMLSTIEQTPEGKNSIYFV